MDSRLADSLAQVRARIAAAARRAGRDPCAITLVAVTKGLPAEAIREALALGLTDVGENRVQEARQKQIALGSRLKAAGFGLEPGASSLEPSVRWHLIGHLQRNKAREAVERFAMIHSVDSPSLIDALERAAAGKRPEPPAQSPEPRTIFLQVNVSGEDSKSGCRPDELRTLAAQVQRCAHLRLGGLMTMAPFSEDPQAARPWFDRLRRLRDELAVELGRPVETLRLSMGMSQDFEVAIEEGADLVRIGTAIFGMRAAVHG
ncbi:MAG: YggS family pyridoxal phosphate-dependent enzyme [Candidatus Omnitrophica bacterium]|nr:YggS family pyridoxal phosphate-dependent enzyme [Candidatus Omnitrophota bacterium]